MDALESYITEKPPGTLYHYTGSAGIIGILQKGQLWASDYRHLNDRKEYRIGSLLLQQELTRSKLTAQQRDSFMGLVRRAQKGCFVLSFSERGDQLSQWRAYCLGGNGYSLGFSQADELFNQAKSHSFNLIRCEYDPKKQRRLCRYLIETFTSAWEFSDRKLSLDDVSERLRAFFDRYQWHLALTLVMSALKHEGFDEEREWRLVSQYPEEALYAVSFRPGRFGVTPYFEMPICKSEGDKKGPCRMEQIVIGPTPNRKAARAALDLLLVRSDTEVGCVTQSRTPFRL